jgi:hypothetical protein
VACCTRRSGGGARGKGAASKGANGAQPAGKGKGKGLVFAPGTLQVSIPNTQQAAMKVRASACQRASGDSAVAAEG